ncbi:hypothetical protein SAMN05444266_1063 [Chitinophaga jiangningensis]|uniref:Uncharacterized protein n=1 Tax=Chitinophaga jiangningensis TaxID=1419482 RepID=A0A1M7F5S8_9BACT|nr:hypothetical protein SAMN05444266_1063 [Chitinophaga jiangningensis]
MIGLICLTRLVPFMCGPALSAADRAGELMKMIVYSPEKAGDTALRVCRSGGGQMCHEAMRYYYTLCIVKIISP